MSTSDVEGCYVALSANTMLTSGFPIQKLAFLDKDMLVFREGRWAGGRWIGGIGVSRA